MTDYLDLSNYERVLKMASKPGKEELEKISLIAGGGITAIGLLGFLIFQAMQFLP